MKTKTNRALSVSAFVFAFGLCGAVQAVNLVSNGGFESWSGGYNGSPSQISDVIGGGYTNLQDWSAGPGDSGLLGFLFAPGSADTSGSRDIRFGDDFTLYGPGNGTNNGLPATSPDGGNYVALDGDVLFNGLGISQTVGGLNVGETYTVGFWWAAAQQHGFVGDSSETMQVTFGSQTLLSPTLSIPTAGVSGWQYQTLDFIATGSSQVLQFIALGTPSGLPPFALLDGVSVVPGSGSAAILGLGMLGFARRPRRR